MAQMDEEGLQARRQRFDEILAGLRREKFAVQKHAGELDKHEAQEYLAALDKTIEAMEGARLAVCFAWQRINTERIKKEHHKPRRPLE